MRRLLVALPLILTWGCFSPSYDGPGGFTCKNSNACPEGYTCVGGLCIAEGASRDGSVDGPVADGPVADGPVADGPVADGPVADGPVADGPVADGPVADGPTPDTLKPDGPSPDTLKPDALLPDGPLPDAPVPDALVPDAPLPDAPLPDTLQPDTLQPDTLAADTGTQPDAWPNPMCNFASSALQSVTSAANILDVALDSHGRAHAFYIDSSGGIYHLWNVPTGSAGGAWTYEQIAKTYTGDRLAAAIDGNDVIHVAFRNPTDSGRPYYLYAPYSPSKATVWAAAQKIVSEDELGDGLDLAAQGSNVFISADRNSTTKGSDFYLWKVNKATTPYSLDKRWVQQTTGVTYEWGRLAVGPVHVATTFFDGTNYQIQATPVGGSTIVAKTVTGNSSGPAPVATLGTNQILVAHVNAMNGLLRYKQWDGQASSALAQASLTGSTVDPYVVDVAAGGTGLAVVVYRDTTATAPYLRYVTRTATSWGTPKLAWNTKVDDVRMVTNPALKQAWMVFSTSGTLRVLCKNY